MPRRLRLSSEMSPNRPVVPSDLGQLKWALSRFGLYDPVEDPGPHDDYLMSPELCSAIERFQDSQRLSVDGRLRPGGPTEARLNFVLGAHDLPGMVPGLHDRNGRPIPERFAEFEARREREATPGIIAGRVGPGLENHPDDLAATERMLAQGGWLSLEPGEAHESGGTAGNGLLDALRRFQSANGLKADAVITPNGETETAMISLLGGHQVLPERSRAAVLRAPAQTLGESTPGLHWPPARSKGVTALSASWPSDGVRIRVQPPPWQAPPDEVEAAAREIERWAEHFGEEILDLPPLGVPGLAVGRLLWSLSEIGEDTAGLIQQWVEEFGEGILDTPIPIPPTVLGNPPVAITPTAEITLRQLYEDLTGPPPTPGDPVAPLQQPGFPGEPPTDPEDERPPKDTSSEDLGTDRLENIPPEVPVEHETFPALDPETLVEGLILEARRGEGHTPRDIDLTRKLVQRLLNLYGGKRRFKADGGGRRREKGVVSWIPEPRYPNANAGPGESGVKGSSFGDYRFTSEDGNVVLLGQHQDVLVDGSTPTRREYRNAERLMNNARAHLAPGSTQYLLETPKRAKGEETKTYLLRILPTVIKQLESQELITGVKYETPLRG